VGALDEYKIVEAGWKEEEAARRRRALGRKRKRQLGCRVDLFGG
jgi:hypothetical protein